MKKKKYRITFSTILNETMVMTVYNKTYKDAIKYIKRLFHSAYDFR